MKKRLGPWLHIFHSGFILLAILASSPCFAKSIRTAIADDSSIIAINTALGYSTILEFQSKPISAVLGDQDSFKLEYVGNSITIKPLLPRAKSNLFVFTEFERFNCDLSTLSPSQVDYIVRVRTKMTTNSAVPSNPIETLGDPNASAFIKKSIRRLKSYNGYTLNIISLSTERSKTNRSIALIDFELSSKKNPYAFTPSSLGVKQSGKFLMIESIFLDQVELVPGAKATSGKIALLAQDFNPAFPFSLIFAVPNRTRKAIHRIEVFVGLNRTPVDSKIASNVNLKSNSLLNQSMTQQTLKIQDQNGKLDEKGK